MKLKNLSKWHFKIEILLVTAVIGIAMFIRLQSPDISHYFNYDEADYMVAMKYGFISNYLGLHEEAGWKYVMRYVNKHKNNEEAHPWHEAMLEGDAAALRHMHPPLGYYFAAILAGMGIENEKIIRYGVLLFGIIAIVCVYFLTRRILLHETTVVRMVFASAAALFVALSPFHIKQSIELGGHAAFSFFAVLFLLTTVLSIQKKSVTWWYASCASLAAGFLSIEYSLLLIPSVLFTAVFLIYKLKLPLRRSIQMLIYGFVFFTFTLFILWPPYIYELAWLKQWITYGNMVINPLAMETNFTRYWLFDTLITHPGFFIGFAAIIFVIVVTVKSGMKKNTSVFWSVVPLLLYTACFLLVNVRVNHIRPLYVAHIIPTLGCISVVALSVVSTQFSRLVRILLTISFFFTFFYMINMLEFNETTSFWKQDFKKTNNRLKGKTYYAFNNGPLLKYYLPGVNIITMPITPKEKNEMAVVIENGQINGFLRLILKTDSRNINFKNHTCVIIQTIPIGEELLQIWQCENLLKM